MTVKYGHGEGSSGQHNSSDLALTDGERASLQLAADGRLKTDAVVTATFIGPQEVLINNADDSVAIGTSTELFTATDVGPKVGLDVNVIGGTITTSGTSTVSGTVNTNQNGLASFQTSQYTIGTSAVQLTVTPLTGRTSMSIKAITTGNNIVYVGNSSGVTTSTGYPLFNGDSLQLDLTGAHVVYAIASAAAQTLAVLEIG